jgi:hypothetical protein
MTDSSIAAKDIEEWIRNERRNHANLPLIPSLVRRGQAAEGVLL